MVLSALFLSPWDYFTSSVTIESDVSEERMNDLDILEFHRLIEGAKNCKNKSETSYSTNHFKIELFSGLILARLMKLERDF